MQLIRHYVKPALKRWRYWRTLLTLLILFAGLLSPLRSQTQLSERAVLSDEMKAKLLKPGNLVLRDTNFVEALFSIRRIWNINIVAGNELRNETVNCEFSETPLFEILDSILTPRGFGYRPLGNSLIVAKLDDADALKPLFESVAIPIEHISADEAVPALELYLSKHGKIQSIPSAKRLLVLDFPERIEMIRGRLSELEAAAKANSANTTSGAGNNVGPNGQLMPSTLRVVYFRPQYVKAESLQAPLQQLLSGEGRLGVIPKDNRLLVMDTPEKINLVTEALRTLDVPRPQVNITALIYDASLEDLQRCGINWNSIGKGNNLNGTGAAQDTLTLATTTAAAPAAGAANGALTVATLGSNLDLTAVINALATTKDSRLLANPNVTVVDQEVAKIEIVTEIPFQQLTQSSGGGNIGTTAFREAGVTLNVTPQIAHDGTIQMLVNPKFSLLTGFTPGDAQPIIDRRETSTTVRVANRQTIALGGLRQRSSIDEKSGIPYLKDIQFLGVGHLFRFKQGTARDSELLVFLTPEIMDFESFTRHRDQQTFWAAQECLDRQPTAVLPTQCNGPNCGQCQPHGAGQMTMVSDQPVGTTGPVYVQENAAQPNYKIAPPVSPQPVAPLPQEATPMVEPLPMTPADAAPQSRTPATTGTGGSTARVVIPVLQPRGAAATTNNATAPAVAPLPSYNDQVRSSSNTFEPITPVQAFVPLPTNGTNTASGGATTPVTAPDTTVNRQPARTMNNNPFLKPRTQR